MCISDDACEHFTLHNLLAAQGEGPSLAEGHTLWTPRRLFQPGGD